MHNSHVRNKSMSKKQKIVLLIIIAILILGGVLCYYLTKPMHTICWPYCPGMSDRDRENIKKAALEAQNNVEVKACTMEAKLCPDGSAVGRSGPDCEFSACPASQPDATAGWQTYKGDGFEFKYPENFGADIWRAFEWPPKATVVLDSDNLIKKGCPNIPDGVAPKKTRITLNGLSYQLFKISDGAAGSTYTTYCYATKNEQNYYAIQFIIRYTTGCGENCGPYCGTEHEAACQNFDKVKEVEKPIEQMVSTLRFSNKDIFK